MEIRNLRKIVRIKFQKGKRVRKELLNGEDLSSLAREKFGELPLR